MAREFNVPPVVFPSGGNPAGGAGGGPSNAASLQPQQRGLPTAPFQPSRSANASIPFMSFDVNSAAASTSFSTPQFPSTISAGGAAGFEENSPLLEELGINTKQIYQKTISILNLFRINAHLHKDADLSGPFLILMAFGIFQLLAGKLHFGIILGWVTVASLFLYIVFNMLADWNGNLDLYTCLSLIGYCILPIVILSAVSLFVPQGGIVIMVLTGMSVIWSTRVCTLLLVELASYGDEHRGLIAYACFLIYMIFSLLAFKIIGSSNPRGSLKATFMLEDRCHVEAKLWCVLSCLLRVLSACRKESSRGGEPHPECLAQVCISCDRIRIYPQ